MSSARPSASVDSHWGQSRALPAVTRIAIFPSCVGDLRGLTPEESGHLEAGWAKVRDEYQAAQQCLLEALEHLNEAAQAYYAAKKMKKPRNER